MSRTSDRTAARKRVTASERATVAPRPKGKSAAISTTFRGNGRSALRTAFTDSTLGASTRQGWRMAVTGDERREHGSSVTQNTAEYVAYNGPNSSTGSANPLTCTTAEKAYKASPAIPVADRRRVLFETRNDHVTVNQRIPGIDYAINQDRTYDPRPVPTAETILNLEDLNNRRGADSDPHSIATATDF